MKPKSPEVIAENKAYAESRQGWSVNEKGVLISPTGRASFDARNLGQMAKDPSIQKKGSETAAKNAKKAKVLQSGFDMSVMSDPAIQAQMINKLYNIAMDPNSNENLMKWAFDMLSKMNVTSQPAEKVEPQVEQKEEMSAKEALDILRKGG